MCIEFPSADAVIIPDETETPKAAPVFLYRVLTTEREVFDFAADRIEQPQQDGTGRYWFKFFLKDILVGQVAFDQVLAVMMADPTENDDVPNAPESDEENGEVSA